MSQNSMFFNVDLLFTVPITSLIVEHLRMWVVRVPRRVDLAALLSWCELVS
jgi:hypothetical protein